MEHYHENTADLRGFVVGTIETFDFRAATEEGRALGEILPDVIADGISERSTRERAAPSTGTWRENEEKYKRRKLRLYGVGETNSRTGQMLSILSLRGKVTIEPQLLTMEYGTGQPPSSGSTGYISDQDRLITDEDKAFYAAEDGRGFYELDETIGRDLDEEVGKCLDAHLKRQG